MSPIECTPDFESWLLEGYLQGWCGPPVCSTHDSTPTTVDEDIDWDDGGDPCIPVIRLYQDLETRSGVEENHSPSRWRASNRWDD